MQISATLPTAIAWSNVGIGGALIMMTVIVITGCSSSFTMELCLILGWGHQARRLALFRLRGYLP